MLDLNDLNHFATVVEHEVYAGAARTLRISNSKLSRGIEVHQSQLGIPVIEFATRFFALTRPGIRCQTVSYPQSMRRRIQNQERELAISQLVITVTQLLYLRRNSKLSHFDFRRGLLRLNGIVACRTR